MTTTTASAVEPARVRLARAHVAMSSGASRRHALLLADRIESDFELLSTFAKHIRLLEETVRTLVATARHVDDLLADGRTGSARRFLRHMVALPAAEPLAPLAPPDALFQPGAA